VEREANYAAVGAFVLLVIAMAGMFVYWYAGARETREYTRYEIYFDGSVSGLTRGAAVRYLGVDVGQVVAMHIDSRNSSRVQVIVDIDSSAPISARTVAELSLQGVTGVLYIDLAENTGSARLAEAVPGEHYRVIRAERSNFDVLLSSLPEMVGLADQVLDRAAKLFDQKNLAAVARSLDNLDKASLALPDTVREVRALVADLRSTSAEFRETAASVRAITDEAGPRVRHAAAELDKIAENLANATGRLDQVVAENRADVRSFARDGLPELERLLHDSQAAAAEIRDLAHGLKENPSQLLYQPSSRGVEIPR
jgi:phospholipid/cholesterol/gamma-HCH transport system substrate-binding protein